MSLIALPDLTEDRTPHWPDDFGGAHHAAPKPRRRFTCRRLLSDAAPFETSHDTMKDVLETAVTAYAMADDDLAELELIGDGLAELRVLALKITRAAHCCLSYGVSYDEELPGWVRLLTSPDVKVSPSL